MSGSGPDGRIVPLRPRLHMVQLLQQLDIPCVYLLRQALFPVILAGFGIDSFGSVRYLVV
jgi:hypothetical protein